MHEAGFRCPGPSDSRWASPTFAEPREAGFPVLLKASAGGGGKGMRLVDSDEELETAYASASAEAEAAFGNGSLYVEKAISPARHVEIQVLCDGDGNVLTLGERECSIQRRHQKLIEESPSTALARRPARRWRAPSSAHVSRSAIETPERSSSSSGPTATSTSSR
jgi:acetyl-CoA carboxylase biotin carboxylase subunit